ncbi:MAG: low specificity L-threonine aldolase, partial [Rhodospirillales bacterium]|nr:low specificity L-threonine aldolase [Rhodospirillales bacterium]
MNFCSDNATGVAPEIMNALARAAEGSVRAYGNDSLTRDLETRIAGLFETEADVFLVATGTAANALAISVLTPPYGSVYCHARAHIETDECGAPEFYTGGCKMVLLEGENGKISAAALETALAKEKRGVHAVLPSVLSLAQITEAGTAYTVDEIRILAGIAHAHGLKVHMDGARFANAIASMACSPADLTWKAGIDALCFGATKNGAMGAEAVVLFDRDHDDDLAYRRKRGGHLVSKMRFLAAQFEAYLSDDLWLKNARHANATAKRLAEGLGGVPPLSVLYPVDGNEIFVTMPDSLVEGLKGDGFDFYHWADELPGRALVRLVTAFNTRPED